MCRKLICLVSFVLVLSLAGSAWSLQILIDDDFNGEGLDIGDAASVNGGFTLVTNALGAAESTAVETGSNAEVSTLGANNANTGIVSNASFDPLSEAALTEGLTVKWVVTSIGPDVHANGNTYMIQTDTVFFNTLPHIGLNFSGAQAGTDQLAVRFRDPPRGIARTIISTQRPYEPSSWNDGFTAEFTISQTGWSYKVTGLNDPSGTPTIFTESNTWVGSGLAETFLSDLLDNDCYVSAFAQEDGCTANYDRCTVYIGEMLPEAAILGPADGAKGVQRDVALSWTPGKDIDKHDVYFGSNFDDVNDATRDNPLGVLVSQNQDSTSYSPAEVLQFGQTYYWRIDEVGPAPDFTVYKGKVWQFTVEPFAYTLPSENITATASSSNSPDEGPENTVNGSGLDADDLHSAEGTDMWLSSAADPNAAWIQYELDDVYKLYEMWVWNYNTSLEPVLGFGVKDATIEYSPDGNEWTALGDFEFARAPGTAGSAVNTTVDLSGVVSKYVKITANSNWGGVAPQKGLSEVRFSYVPVLASQPIPSSGTVDMDVDNVTLSWRAGRETALHEVQLSTDQQAVIDGTAPVVSVSETSYDTGELELGQTYYWKINEVNEAETPTSWAGDIWSFATQEYLVVDDFESYNDLDPDDPNSNRIFSAWIDGYEQPANGSIVGYSAAPFAEQTIVHSGGQSMPLFYDNSSTARYSEAELALSQPQDWTRHGIKSLSLWFRGDPNNAITEQMYVKLNASKVLYDGEAANLARTTWQPWNINLADFSVNLSNVTELSIGLERSGAVGGKGVIYLDDIRLYAYDRQLVTPTEPDTASLVAHYEFEGTANDSSVNGLHGTIMGEPNFVAGRLGQAISLDGVGDYVEITGYKGICIADPNDPNSVQPAFSITAWVNTSGNGDIMGWGSTPGGVSRVEFRINEDRLRCESGGNVQGDNTLPDNEWIHVAVTVKENATISYPDVKLYLNGQDDTRKTTDPDALNVVAGYDVTIGRRHSAAQRWYSGLIDEVRIYERALSDAEVAWLAGRIKPFDNPF